MSEVFFANAVGQESSNFKALAVGRSSYKSAYRYSLIESIITCTRIFFFNTSVDTSSVSEKVLLISLSKFVHNYHKTSSRVSECFSFKQTYVCKAVSLFNKKIERWKRCELRLTLYQVNNFRIVLYV